MTTITMISATIIRFCGVAYLVINPCVSIGSYILSKICKCIRAKKIRTRARESAHLLRASVLHCARENSIELCLVSRVWAETFD